MLGAIARPFIGQALIMAFMNVAKGIAKNTPQNPQIPPNTKTAVSIAIGCSFTVSENIKGTRIFQ